MWNPTTTVVCRPAFMVFILLTNVEPYNHSCMQTCIHGLYTFDKCGTTQTTVVCRRAFMVFILLTNVEPYNHSCMQTCIHGLYTFDKCGTLQPQLYADVHSWSLYF